MTAMKTPKFWYDNSKLWATLLAPASALYQIGHNYNQKNQKAVKSPVPVICVGNATAGGSGKTPACIALKQIINTVNGNKKIYFLTRGYKGTMNGAVWVDDRIHDHLKVGDEAFLLARHAPTIKSIDRMKGLERAKEERADLVIMDDGLQNNTIAKDLSFMIVDGASGFGNKMTLPSGPLREPLYKAFAKTDAFILVGDDIRNVKMLLPAGKPVFRARIKTQPLEGVKKVIAFCGIGLPQKFKKTLEECGYKIIAFHEFPDHHPFKKEELVKMIREAEKQKATLITTEKDIVRIKNEKILKYIKVQKIEMVFDKPELIRKFLAERLP